MSTPSFQLPKCNVILTLKAMQCPQPAHWISLAFDMNCLSTLQAECCQQLFVIALCMYTPWCEHTFLEIWGCLSGSDADKPSSNTLYYIHYWSAHILFVSQTQELHLLHWGKCLYLNVLAMLHAHTHRAVKEPGIRLSFLVALVSCAPSPQRFINLLSLSPQPPAMVPASYFSSLLACSLSLL